MGIKHAVIVLVVSSVLSLSGCGKQLKHPTKPRSEWSSDHAVCEKEVRAIIRGVPETYTALDELKMIKNACREKAGIDNY